MYCKYVYYPGCTYANFVADMVKVFTGTGSLADLSSQCDKTRSELVTTLPAGWTVHDASPGGNYQVLTAPWADGLGYKYAKVGSLYDSPSSSYVNICHGYETWNASTHSGTGLVANSDTGYYAQRFDQTLGGTLYLFSSARFMMMLGVNANGTMVGGSSYSGPSGLFEHTRQKNWCTAQNGVGPWGWTNLAWTGSYDTGFCPVRCKKAATGTLENGLTIALGVPGGHGISAALNTGTPEYSLDNPSTLSFHMYPLILTGILWDQYGSGGVSGYHGNLTSPCDLWGIQWNTLCHEDTFTWNNRNYIALLNSGNVSIAARKE